MYGSAWPQDGEVDGTEANLGNNYVTWHNGVQQFGGNRIQVFYDGYSHVTLPEALTGTTDDPNACANGTTGVGVSGDILIKWLRVFLPPTG